MQILILIVILIITANTYWIITNVLNHVLLVHVSPPFGSTLITS